MAYRAILERSYFKEAAKMLKNDKYLTLRIPDKVYEHLKALAKENECSVGFAVREALKVTFPMK